MRRYLPVLAGCLLLSACVTRQLAPDFTTFSSAYARDMNWQMLLNLARLDQGHPAYFMTIGEVRVNRSSSGSLNTSGNSSRTESSTVANTVSRTVSTVLGGTITPNLSTSAQPSFVYIPVNSKEAATQLLSPISIDVFNNLYQQGWPVDQLLRVMVERIEVDAAATANPSQREHLVLHNSPTRAVSADDFARFLRACEVVRELQKRGGLQLRMQEVSPPPSAKKPEPPAKTKPAGDKAGAAEPEATPEAPRALYNFKADQKILDEVLAQLGPTYATFSRDNFRDVFRSTLTVTSDSRVPVARDPGRDDQGDPIPHSTLVLRSFRNVLDAVAQEQRAFDALKKDPSFLAQVPERQRRPILRTDWGEEKGTDLLSPVSSLSYGNHTYQITDPKAGAADLLQARWNRDVFRLLVDLSAYVNVDITKFQRQIFELTQ